jgi:putative endonuclease
MPDQTYVYIMASSFNVSTSASRQQLKDRPRIKKLRLIIAQNSTWNDLSAEWDKPIAPYIEASS